MSYLVDHGAADQAAYEVSVATRQAPLLTLPSGTEWARASTGNGEPLLCDLGQYFVDAGVIFCQAGTPGQVGLSAAELA